MDGREVGGWSERKSEMEKENKKIRIKIIP